jgi:predicted hydrocarbon binding protein
LFRRSSKQEIPREDLFDVDLEHGIVKQKTDGSRVIALRSVGWATMESELTSTFITGAAVILQRMGYSYGRYLGKVAKSEEKGSPEALQALQDFARESGWGELSLNSGNLDSGVARLVLKNCFFCQHIRDSDQPVCYILAGLVGGVIDEIVGKDHRVQEERCIAKGDAVCEILVERI